LVEAVKAKYFRISALVLELRMLIFFRSEKKSVNETGQNEDPLKLLFQAFA